MTKHLRPLKEGDPITDGPHSSAAWSEVVSNIRKIERIQKTGPNNVPSPLFADRTMVRVKNASGVKRNRFDVLGISDSLLDPAEVPSLFKSQIKLTGVTPDASDHTGKFVILAQAIDANAVGWAWISGICVAHVDFDSEAQEYADIKDGDAGLLAGAGSGAAQVLWKESGTGPKWAVVRLGNPGGGGGASAIKFKVIAVGPPYEADDYTCNTVVGEVLHVPCSATDVVVGQEIIVWDIEGCAFGIPDLNLLNAIGWAQKMAKPDGLLSECENDDPSESCIWMIQILSCCLEEVYAG